MQSGAVVGGKYRLRRELGQGAMGSVWSATHELLGREVAIKFLLPSLEGAETAAARFEAEAKAAARVKHRYVVDVFDFGITEDGHHYMVQELLDGVALADDMYREPAWSLPDLLSFTAACLSGLEAVHQSGIVHRDLKPENIFVVRDAEGTHPKLLDFGISKSADSSAGRSVPRLSMRPGRPRALTMLGTTIGTPAYMSPEQLCNASTMNGRADLYSMGVILYEWLTGRVPFGDTSNPTELYRRIQDRLAPSLTELRPDLPRELCSLVDRALEPDPALRFASATEMRAEIVRVLPTQPLLFSTVQRSSQVELALPARPTQAKSTDWDDDEPVSIPGLSLSRSWLFGALLAACLALVAVAGWSYTKSSSVRAGAPTPRASTRGPRVAEPALPPHPASPVVAQTQHQQAEREPAEPAAASALVLGKDAPDEATVEDASVLGADTGNVATPPTRSTASDARHGRAVERERGPASKPALGGSEPSVPRSRDTTRGADKNDRVVRTLDF